MSSTPSPIPDNSESSLQNQSDLRKLTRPRLVGTRNSRSLRYTLLLGAIAGLAFSMALWAYEAFLFFEAHVAYAWLPFFTGTILCVLICILASLLTYLVNKALLGVVFWVAAARLIAELATRLPLKITPALMIFMEPALRSRLPDYPMTETLRTWAGIGTVWLGIFLGILGLLQLTLVESAVPAATSAGRLTPYFIFIPVMVLASVMSSNLINEQLRAPLIATDDMIQFAIDHQSIPVDPVIARQMHLGSLNTVTDLINRPRRLFLGKYDQYYSQVDVLVDFGGEWVDCSTVSAQPVFCTSISNP